MNLFEFSLLPPSPVISPSRHLSANEDISREGKGISLALSLGNVRCRKNLTRSVILYEVFSVQPAGGFGREDIAYT